MMTRPSPFSWLALLLLGALLAPSAWAGPKNPFSVATEPAVIEAGQTGELRVTFKVPFGTYLYQDMSSVEVLDAGALSLGEPDLAPGVMRFDEAFGVERPIWEMDAVAVIPVKAAPAGEHEVLVEVRYQGCRDGLCFLPETEQHSLTVSVPAVATGGLGLGLIGEARAEDPPEGAPAELSDENPVLVEVSAKGTTITAEFRQMEGWHCNATLTFMELDPEGPFTLSEPTWPEAHERPDPAMEGMTRPEYDGDFTVTAEVSGPPGPQKVVGTVGYQACKANLCLIPQYVDFALDMSLPGEAGQAPPSKTPEAAPVASELPPGPEGKPAPAVFGGDFITDAREKGLAWLVLAVFLAGIGVSFTPCVLPMVPITLGIIGASSSGSKLKAVGLASTYVLGLATVYTALMVASALTGSVFGTWMQSPWVVGAVALFFAAMGTAMFGFFEVGVPSGIATRLNEAGGAGWKGSFIVGAVGAIVAGPCSGPVIAALMALIGQQGEVGLGVALGFVFSLGMGMIFIGSSLASDVLFRPGVWMDTVKKSFGVVMWLGAIYFVSAHLSDAATALLTAAVLLSTAVFGWPPREEDDGYSTVPKVHKLYGVAAGLVGAYLLVGTLVTSGFILPPIQLSGGGSSAAASHGAISWADSEPAGLARAAAEGKPMVLDFTADWCAACKELEHLTYTDERVISRAKGFVTVMVDATSDKDPEVARLFEKYGVTGLPNVLFIRPDGTVIQELTLTGFEEADTFVKRMDAALAEGA
ncbi:MAG: thioredoxin family protein [Alphaproteobacteria bacterium]|nr:thioredoxin family protein [Alphaproteobacteria bacterium]